jgi:hypothetical protein
LGNRHDLLELKDRIQTSIEVCIQNFKRELAIKRDRVYHDLNAKRWKCLDPQLNQQIVPQAMELLVKQLHLAKDELRVNPCSGSFMSIHGIPCYHIIRDLQQYQEQITRRHFHYHWHFERPNQLTLPPPSAAPGPSIFPPHVVITRGRPRNDHSTRRSPSQFEVTAGTAVPRRKPGRVGGESTLVSYVTSPAV